MRSAGRRTALSLLVRLAADLIASLAVLLLGDLSLGLRCLDLELAELLVTRRRDIEVDAHQHGGRLAVHLLDHLAEELVGLELVDQQRILVLIASVLHRVAQLVHLTQVLLPRLIDVVQDDGLLELLHDRATLAGIGVAEVAADIVDEAAIGQRHHDALVDLALLLVDLMEYRISLLGDQSGAALEGGLDGVVE